MFSNMCSMHKIKNLVAKGKRNYNATNIFVNKRNNFVIYETIFKKPKFITKKSCVVGFWKEEDRELIKQIINGEMIDEEFCVGILLVRCIPRVLFQQWLQCKAITNTLNMIRQRGDWWNNVGKKTINNMMRHTKGEGV